MLLVHVIEHLRSPATAVSHIAGLLKPGGMLYVECPNLQAPLARRSQLFHTAHIFTFVPETLQSMGQACGFRLRKRFGDEQDVNLQMLFQHSGECRLNIDPQVCHRTLDGLRRAAGLPYHLRWRYLTDRAQKIAGYAREHLASRNFVADLIDECHQTDDDSQSSTRPSRAA